MKYVEQIQGLEGIYSTNLLISDLCVAVAQILCFWDFGLCHQD